MKPGTVRPHPPMNTTRMASPFLQASGWRNSEREIEGSSWKDGEEVRTEGRRVGACVGLTGACCRRGAGRSPGSPPPTPSLSLGAPWSPGSRTPEPCPPLCRRGAPLPGHLLAAWLISILRVKGRGNNRDSSWPLSDFGLELHPPPRTRYRPAGRSPHPGLPAHPRESGAPDPGLGHGIQNLPGPLPPDFPPGTQGDPQRNPVRRRRRVWKPKRLITGLLTLD